MIVLWCVCVAIVLFLLMPFLSLCWVVLLWCCVVSGVARAFFVLCCACCRCCVSVAVYVLGLFCCCAGFVLGVLVR